MKKLIVLLITISICSILGCKNDNLNQNQKIWKHTVYFNKDFGFEFSFPKTWEIIEESKYQRSSCHDPEYRKTNPSCGLHPRVTLKNKKNTAVLVINLRQSSTKIELKGGHWISFDYASPLDEWEETINDTNEKFEYLEIEVKDAIMKIKKSFQIIK